jgi:hypothetical protein
VTVSVAGSARDPSGRGRSRALLAAFGTALIVFVGLAALRFSSLSGPPAGPGRAEGTPGADGRPASGWARLPLPPEVRSGAAHVWAEDQLVAWGGCDPEVKNDCAATAGGYTFDPSNEAWRAIPRAPLRASDADGVWTGHEIVFLRFRDGRPLDGAAYDPAKRDWHMISPAPIRPEYGSAEVWTGSELVVFGGGERGSPSASNGAAYDPSTDRWRRIAQAPIGLNATSGMWTGREVLVFGSLLNNRNIAETHTSVGAAYDPDRDRWREIPPSELSPQATSAVWVGGSMVAWDYDVHSQVFDPRSNHWSKPVKMPLDFSECYPDSVPVHELAFAFFCGRIALFDPEHRAWTEIHGGLVDSEIWSKAYERYLKVWRFADLVPAGNQVFLVAEGLTLNGNGVACYGCSGADESFWSYRPSASTLAQDAQLPVTAASAYQVADEFMAARTLGAAKSVDRVVTSSAADQFESTTGVPEPLLAGTSYSIQQPTAVDGQSGSFDVVVELSLKGKVGKALGMQKAREILRIGPGRTLSGRNASLAVLTVASA